MKNPVFDKDLTSLLKNCENDDLDPIVQTILSLPSQTMTLRPEYKEHQGDHKSYVDAIVYEITSLGGHTLANLARGHGVSYADMVHDVAEKLDVTTSSEDSVGTLEEKIILRILRLSAREMSEEDRVALADLLALEREINGRADDDDLVDEEEDEDVDGEDDEIGDEGDRDYSGETLDDGQLEGETESFPEAEVSRRLADSATALAGDRILSAVEHVARTTRVRRTMVAASKALIVKAVTSPLGGAISWIAALGRGLHDLMGPNYAASLLLIAHIGLIRQKYEQIERDMINDEVEDGSIALT